MTHFVLMSMLIFSFLENEAVGFSQEEVSSREPKAVAILQEAHQALKAAKNISYSFSYRGGGWMVGDFRGSAKVSHTSNRFNSRLSISMDMPAGNGGRVAFSDENVIERKSVQLASDGEKICVLDKKEKTYTFGATDKAAHLFFYSYYVVWPQLVNAEPFENELKADNIKRVGTEVMNGVLCDIVYVVDPFGSKTWWYLGSKDRLPRAQKLLNDSPGREANFFFVVNELKTETVFSPEDFHLQAPDGFESINEDLRPIEVGAAAPELILHTPGGGPAAFSTFMGRVTVLDFWASWCPPCWSVMPKIDRLAQEFSDARVDFIAVNTWENPQINPVKYMTEKSLKYRLLYDETGSAAMAYKLTTLPGIFVIGPSGKIVYSNVGDRPELEDEIRTIIQQALR